MKTKKKAPLKRKRRAVTQFPFERPLRVSVIDKRVAIIDSAGALVTEVYPGQILGKVPSVERTISIASALVDCVNRRRA